MKSERSGSFTSLAGRIMESPIMPQGCWDSSDKLNPRAHPIQAHWWYTAGKRSPPELWKEVQWGVGSESTLV